MAWLVDVILPSHCVTCGTFGPWVCDGCRAKLVRLRTPLCGRCGAPTAWPVSRCVECSRRRLGFASARAAVAYTGATRSIVAAWKQRGLRRLAVLAAELVVEEVPRPAADVITYIPPDGDRSLRRGHHPAQRLARELAAAWEIEACSLLGRTRAVERQAGLSLVERRRNVRGAFRPAAPAPALVLLVDDVYTTGATVAAASTALRAGGARRIDVVTFARAVR
jgi:predicted amidophosphoribosyltransferase